MLTRMFVCDKIISRLRGVYYMLEQLLERKYIIKELLEKDEKFIDELTSEELFQIIITFSNDEEIRPSIEKQAKKILDRCIIDYDMFNAFTIICMRKYRIAYEEAVKCLDQTINNVFYRGKAK